MKLSPENLVVLADLIENNTGTTITTSGGEITFDGVTTINSNLTIDSSVAEDNKASGDITFTDTLDSFSAGSQSIEDWRLQIAD